MSQRIFLGWTDEAEHHVHPMGHYLSDAEFGQLLNKPFV